jgi:uncharacterized protein
VRNAADLTIGLFSRCMGCVSTFATMTRFSAAFEGVRCVVSLQPITPRYTAELRLAAIGLGNRLDDFDTLPSPAHERRTQPASPAGIR